MDKTEKNLEVLNKRIKELELELKKEGKEECEWSASAIENQEFTHSIYSGMQCC